MARDLPKVRVYKTITGKYPDNFHIERLAGKDMEGEEDPHEGLIYKDHKILKLRGMTKKERKEQIDHGKYGCVPVVIEVEGKGHIFCFVSQFDEPYPIEGGA